MGGTAAEVDAGWVRCERGVVACVLNYQVLDCQDQSFSSAESASRQSSNATGGNLLSVPTVSGLAPRKP